MLEDVLSSLFYIARADGDIRPLELPSCAGSPTSSASTGRFERIRGDLHQAGGADPYPVLGLSHAATSDEVKRTYRRLICEHHPDMLSAKGAAQAFIEMATRKMAAINAAYDQIGRERGMK